MGEHLHEPGATFSDGKLCIFSEDEVMVIRGWPEATAVRKGNFESRWAPFVPGFPLVRPYRRPRRAASRGRAVVNEQPSLFSDSELPKPRKRLTLVQRRARAFHGFRFSLPKDVQRVLEPIRYGQWAMLQFMTVSWKAIELAESNPTLAYCVAVRLRHSILSEPHQIDAVVGVIGQKRRRILEWLRMPATEATVRVLGKIHPASLAPWVVDSLRDCLDEPESVKEIGHLRSINMGVISLLASPRLRDHSGSRLLKDVASDKRERHYAFTAELLERTLDMRDAVAADRRVPVFHSKEEIHRFHDEGERQRNCVGSYARYVERGETYIYRVLKPSRATLAIARGPDGQWHRGELLAADNEPVESKTERAVDRWLASHVI